MPEQSTLKHTPGPWFAEARDDAIIDIGPERSEVATIFSEHMAYPSESDWANARLIAAAPDLLFALQTIMGDAEHGQGMRWSERCMIARAAIAKAEGK